jgi:chromosome segregation ATPase
MKNNQKGMTTLSVAIITGASVAAVAGALAAWQQINFMHVRAELSEAKSEIRTANDSANAARTQLNAIRKELDEHKLDFDQMRAERDSAKNLLDAEKQYTERMRLEVAALREKLDAATAPRARSAQPAAPQLVQPRNFRIVPSGAGSAQVQASPAR